MRFHTLSLILALSATLLCGTQASPSWSQAEAGEAMSNESVLAKRQTSSSSSVGIRSSGSSSSSSSFDDSESSQPTDKTRPFHILYFTIGRAHKQWVTWNGTKFDNCGLWVLVNKTARTGAFFRPDPTTGRWAYYDNLGLPQSRGNEAGEIDPARWNASRPDDAQALAARFPVATGRPYTAPWCRRQSRALRKEWRRQRIVRLTSYQKSAGAFGGIFGGIPTLGLTGGAGFGVGVGVSRLFNPAGLVHRPARPARPAQPARPARPPGARAQALQMALLAPMRAGRGDAAARRAAQELRTQVDADAAARDRWAQEEARQRVETDGGGPQGHSRPGASGP